MNNPYYYPNYYMPQNNAYSTQNNAQGSNDERIWVANETQAEAYLVAPGGFARLWDSTKPVFYEKQSDMTGRQYPMVAYKYEKITEETLSVEDRLKAIEEKIKGLEKKRGKKNDEESNDADATA